MQRVTGYSSTQIALHWITATLVLSVLFTHEWFLTIWGARDRGLALGEFDSVIWNLHVLGGTLVVPLTLWRLLLRRRIRAPPPPALEPRPLRLLASTVQWALYILTVMIPLTGLARFWNIAPTISASLHQAMSALLFILVLLHSSGALVHHYFWKTDVLQRMIKSRLEGFP